MDSPNYLLTYTDCGEDGFAWFESEEEMTEFIVEQRVSVIEAWHIKDAEKIEFD